MGKTKPKIAMKEQDNFVHKYLRMCINAMLLKYMANMCRTPMMICTTACIACQLNLRSYAFEDTVCDNMMLTFHFYETIVE